MRNTKEGQEGEEHGGRKGKEFDGGERERGTQRREERARNTTEGREGQEHEGGERG